MPVFHKALLLFNPVSGAHLECRTATMRRIAEIFRRAGVEVAGGSHAGARLGGQSRRARPFGNGCDAVFACGGDGTVFEVLQGVAETPAMMGVIPLGTGNVLAHDLGLAVRPERAAAQILSFTPQTISLGRIQTMGRSRFFTVAAGVGVHAELLYRANARAKQTGRIPGLLLAWGPTALPPCVCALSGGDHDQRRRDDPDYRAGIGCHAGAFLWRTAAPLASRAARLLSPELRLVLLRNPSRAHILRYTPAGAHRPRPL